MNRLKGNTTLDGIVSNVIWDIGEQNDMGNYLRYMQWAIRVYKELNLFHLRQPRYVKVAMSDINTVDYPDDWLGFISVSVPVNGQYWTMTKNGKLIVPMSIACGEETLDEDEGETVIIGDGDEIVGFPIGGGRNNYYYRLDDDNQRIIINGFNRSTVILAYRSTGIRVDGQNFIPKVAEEAMIAGVHALRLRHNSKATRGDKADAEIRYELEQEKLEVAKRPSLDDVFDAIYETIYQGVKR